MTMKVFYLVDAVAPWVLAEVVELRRGRTRRLLCFDSLAGLRAAIDERLAWHDADEAFVDRHLAALDSAVTGDWVPSRYFDQMFGATREEFRRGTRGRG